MTYAWRNYSIPYQIDFLEHYMEYKMHMPVITCNLDQLNFYADELLNDQSLNIKPISLKQQIVNQVEENDLKRKQNKLQVQKQIIQSQKQAKRNWRLQLSKPVISKEQQLVQFLQLNQKLVFE